MISIVYWQDDFPTRYRLGLNLSTLLGSMVGQVVLGYLADRIGRRKVYGLELAFTIVASLAFATASPGTFNSMSLIGILIFWRLVMGIGIGSDYPLSAVLTAEWAEPPSEHWLYLLIPSGLLHPNTVIPCWLQCFSASHWVSSLQFW